MADIIIPAKLAHDALALLLDQLAMANTKTLVKKDKGKNTKSKNQQEWQAALRTAMDEIDEWCPSFTLTLPPK